MKNLVPFYRPGEPPMSTILNLRAELEALKRRAESLIAERDELAHDAHTAFGFGAAIGAALGAMIGFTLFGILIEFGVK